MPLSVQSTKLVTTLIIFLCGLFSTISPLFIVGTNEALFSAGNMMAAGVLLAAGLVHQLADSASSLEQEDGFPWSFFLCGLTFILFLIFEESVHLLLAGDHRHGEDEKSTIEMEGRSCRGSIVIPTVDEKKQQLLDYGATHEHSHSHDEHQPFRKKRPSILRSLSHPRRVQESRLSVSIFGERNESMHHHHDDHISEHLHGSLLASLMLLMALSIHSVLAGLSIGLVQEVPEIYSTALAIVAHKVFAGYALGSTMAAADLGYDRCVVLGTVFASSTPLGIFIGMCMESFDEDSSSIGIVKAIVAGTFLYVSIIEVGMKELLICRDSSVGSLRVSQKQVEVAKLVSMMAGFLGMSYLAKFV